MTKVPSIGIINSRASSGSSRASILFNMDLRCRKYLDVSSCVITLQCCRKFSSQDLCAAGSSRVANIAGNCVCSQDSTEIQGTCVKLSLLVPCIVTPLFVIGLMAAWYYHEASFLLIPPLLHGRHPSNLYDFLLFFIPIMVPAFGSTTRYSSTASKDKTLQN